MHMHVMTPTHMHQSLVQESKISNSQAPMCWHNLQAWVQAQDSTSGQDEGMIRLHITRGHPQKHTVMKAKRASRSPAPTFLGVWKRRRWGREIGVNRGGARGSGLSLEIRRHNLQVRPQSLHKQSGQVSRTG